MHSKLWLAAPKTQLQAFRTTCVVLARRPDVWAKLKEEVNQLNEEKLTYDQLNTMNYLRH